MTEAKTSLEEEKTLKNTLRYTVVVSRRQKKDQFASTDIKVTVSYHDVPAAKSSQPLINVLHLIYSSLVQILDKIKTYFDTSQKRLIFISCHSSKFISDLYVYNKIISA